jgi:hypothetical protein
MEFDGPFNKDTTDPDPGLQEIRPLVAVQYARGKYLQRFAGLRSQFVLIEIAMSPDKMK